MSALTEPVYQRRAEGATQAPAVATPKWPLSGAVIAALMCLCVILPREKVFGPPVLDHIGIARGAPNISLYALLILGVVYVAVLAGVHEGRSPAGLAPWTAYFFGVILCFQLSLVWKHD